MSEHQDNPAAAKGVSLSRGPALILGAILLVAGLYFLYKLHGFPRLSQFPGGRAHVQGRAFLGIFGVNGWSGELTAAAGGLLLFGAAHHVLAKATSLTAGTILAVVAIIALVNHDSALGLFAANVWTIILWGASAALLLINSLAPRARARRSADAAADHRVGQARAGTGASGTRSGAPIGRAPAARPAAATPVTVSSSARTDADTIVPERGAIRVRPSAEVDGARELDE